MFKAYKISVDICLMGDVNKYSSVVHVGAGGNKKLYGDRIGWSIRFSETLFEIVGQLASNN